MVRASLRAAMIPTVNGMMTIGLVQLPGMMTGQILAGSSPLVAIRYQMVVVFMQGAATALGSLLFVRLAAAAISLRLTSSSVTFCSCEEFVRARYLVLGPSSSRFGDPMKRLNYNDHFTQKHGGPGCYLSQGLRRSTIPRRVRYHLRKASIDTDASGLSNVAGVGGVPLVSGIGTVVRGT